MICVQGPGPSFRSTLMIVISAKKAKASFTILTNSFIKKIWQGLKCASTSSKSFLYM